MKNEPKIFQALSKSPEAIYNKNEIKWKAFQALSKLPEAIYKKNEKNKNKKKQGQQTKVACSQLIQILPKVK